MKIEVWWVGKTQRCYRDQIDQYLKKIQRFHPTSIVEFRSKKSLSPDDQKKYECELFLKNLNNSDRLILLDEKGEKFSSEEFCSFISRHLMSSVSKIVLVLGGPFGLHKDMYEKAQVILSLSPLTFTHDMARLILIEQIYRAFTIRNNLPYHHP